MKKVLTVITIALLIFQIVVLATEWDVSTASYDTVFGDLTAETSSTIDEIWIKADGSKLYIVHDADNRVYQYSLTTPWLASSATYDNKTIEVTSMDTTPFGIFLKPDGVTMYICGNSADVIGSWTLSTAWDVSTATDDGEEIDISAQETSPQGIYFKPDGTYLYVCGNSGNDVGQYHLNTPWDMTSAHYDNKLLDVSGEVSVPKGLYIRSDGEKLFITGGVNKTVFQYTLSTPWDVSTGTYDEKSFSAATQEATLAGGLFLKDDGLRFYVTGYARKMFQYSMPAAAADETNVIWYGTNQ